MICFDLNKCFVLHDTKVETKENVGKVFGVVGTTWLTWENASCFKNASIRKREFIQVNNGLRIV